MSEEYIEEGINGQWTDWKFEAENYKKIYEHLYQENKQLKEVVEEVRKYIEKHHSGNLKITFGEDILQILDKVKEN